MRVSTYEMILPLTSKDGEEIPGYKLLINGLYGAMDIVSKEDAEEIASSNLSVLSSTLIEQFARRGHFTEKTAEEELDDLKLLARIYSKTFGRLSLGISIMPTYDCNFRCPYCYEQHRLKHGQEWLSYTISDEMLEATFSAVKKYREKGYDVGKCNFYGGEPFLEKNLSLVKKIAEHCRELGMKMSAITNGYDLAAYIDLLDEFDFGLLQITVDGMGEVNNRSRIHKDGYETYERILSNIELALSHGVTVNLRTNIVHKNLHGIKDLIDDLKARGFIDKETERRKEEYRLKQVDPKAKTKRGEFHYYFKSAHDLQHPENNVKEQSIIEELVKYGMTVEETFMHQSCYNYPASRLRDMLKKETFADFDPAFCGSEKGMLKIDPFGRLYSCADFVDRKGMDVGFVDTKTGNFIFNFELAKWRTRTVDLMEKCQTCPYCFICRGGCAASAYYQFGDWRREACEEIREIFDFIASRVVGAHWQEHHESELSLSLLEPLSKLTKKERETVMTSKSQQEIFNIAKECGLLSIKVTERNKNGA